MSIYFFYNNEVSKRRNLYKRFGMLFKKRFKIETPIQYIEDMEVSKQIKKNFMRSWKRFYSKSEPIISPYREERLSAFFRQLERDGSDERYCLRVEIRFINPVVGYGVFAKENIAPYSTLHHYVGVLMIDKKIHPDDNSTFSFTHYKTYSINAMKKGNWTRFMNHSPDGNPKTNVIPWEYYLPEGPRIVFTSGRFGIKKGMQLLYSYGDDYWEDRKFLSF